MLKQLLWMLRDPPSFFESLRGQGWRSPLWFLLAISTILAVFTALVNALGCPSTDLSAATQAQILAWRVTETHLLPQIGPLAYLLEIVLIPVISLWMALLLSVFIHLVYRLLGGKGNLSSAWIAVCYGLGPTVLLGWVPYFSLFVATWSLVLQFYVAPKTLYRMQEGRAVMILAFIVAATLLEFASKGTTVGFGPAPS